MAFEVAAFASIAGFDVEAAAWHCGAFNVESCGLDSSAGLVISWLRCTRFAFRISLQKEFRILAVNAADENTE